MHLLENRQSEKLGSSERSGSLMITNKEKVKDKVLIKMESGKKKSL